LIDVAADDLDAIGNGGIDWLRRLPRLLLGLENDEAVAGLIAAELGALHEALGLFHLRDDFVLEHLDARVLPLCRVDRNDGENCYMMGSSVRMNGVRSECGPTLAGVQFPADGLWLTYARSESDHDIWRMASISISILTVLATRKPPSSKGALKVMPK
jgi:hypothetical protein